MKKAESSENPKPRLSARRASRETEILNSARQRFAHEGYERTSMSDVAKDVGIAEGTIYTYFETKRALLHRIISVFYEPLIAEVSTNLRGISGVRNRIRYLVWRQLKAFTDEPQICYLIIRELQPTADSYDSIVVGLARKYTSLALDVLSEGIATGEIRSGASPYLVRAMIYGTVENVAWRLTYRKKTIGIEQIADEVADILMQGISGNHPSALTAETIQLLEDFLRKAPEGVNERHFQRSQSIKNPKTKGPKHD